MTIKDLKSGMVVKFRNGKMGVCRETHDSSFIMNNLLITIGSGDTFIFKDYLTNDLKCIHGQELDIIEVRVVKNFKRFDNYENEEDSTVIWRRKELRIFRNICKKLDEMLF